MSTIHEEISLETESCCNCGVIFAMPAPVMRERRTNGGSFYCPNGHGQHYSKSEVEKLREKLSETQSELTRAKCRVVEESNRRQVIESELNHHKVRAKNGVCPCCHRSFQNLKRHIKTKHPGFPDEGKKAK